MEYNAGDIIKGKVTGIKPYGAFITLEDNYTGLLHISEISDSYVKHPSDVLKVGQVVKVRVLTVDVKKNRIGLTMRSQTKNKG